jgi:copper(I)-binding protein
METIMKLKSILLGAALSLSALPAFAEIVIEHAYARSASPAARSGAVFLVVHNTGPEADRLIAAETTAAKRTGLHTNIIEEGIAKMVSVPEGFEIAAGAELYLQRGGHHVMLMGLTAPFVQGEELTLTLTFEQAGEMTLVVPIDNERDGEMHMGEMNHDGMEGMGVSTAEPMAGMSNN